MQQWLHERAAKLRYTYFACLITLTVAANSITYGTSIYAVCQVILNFTHFDSKLFSQKLFWITLKFSSAATTSFIFKLDNITNYVLVMWCKWMKKEFRFAWHKKISRILSKWIIHWIIQLWISLPSVTVIGKFLTKATFSKQILSILI